MGVRLRTVQEEILYQRKEVLKDLNKEFDNTKAEVKEEFEKYLILESIEHQTFENLSTYNHDRILNTLKEQAVGDTCDSIYFRFHVEDFEYKINDDIIAIYFHNTNELLLWNNTEEDFKDILINIKIS